MSSLLTLKRSLFTADSAVTRRQIRVLDFFNTLVTRQLNYCHTLFKLPTYSPDNLLTTSSRATQPAFTCSELKELTLEQGVKYVQS